jgi:hypothetical protein
VEGFEDALAIQVERSVPVGDAEDPFAGRDDVTVPRGLVGAADGDGSLGMRGQQGRQRIGWAGRATDVPG